MLCVLNPHSNIGNSESLKRCAGLLRAESLMFLAEYPPAVRRVLEFKAYGTLGI